MPTYCYFDFIEIGNEAEMQNYRSEVLATVDRYKGRFVVIGGPCIVKEGNSRPVFPVMIEFPDLAHAESWYDSSEYRQIMPYRMKAARANVMFLQGI